ncbi:UNVERIFIED_CONTAM: hypothetical protein FKN15_055437 [Acipenser sinensis]
MGSLFEKMDEKETESPLLHGCLETLALIYFSLDSKNPLKRALASALSAVPGRLQGGAVEILSVCLQERLGAESPAVYRAVTDCVTGCLESFSLVFQFLQKALTSYHEQNSSLHGNHIAQTQLMQDCLAAVKASMVVVQRSQERICGALQAQHGSLLWETMSGLLSCFTSILIDGNFLQTVQSTSGMAVVLFIRTMLEHKDNLASLRQFSTGSNGSGLTILLMNFNFSTEGYFVSSLHGNHIAQTQLMQDCLAAVKASMVVVQRSQERICGALQAQHGSLLWETMSGLLSCFTSILIDGNFLQTVQSTSGMAVVLFIRTMLEHKDNLASLRQFSTGSNGSGLTILLMNFNFSTEGYFVSSLHGNHIAQTQLMQDCLAAVKASMVVVQRSQERICGALQAQHGSLLWETMSGLLSCFTSILIDGNFLQTVQSTSGMAVVLFIRTMLEHKDNLASLVDDLLAGAEESLSAAPRWLSGSCTELYSRERPAPVALFLCHGALAMLSWRSRELGGRGEELLLHIPSVLLELNSQLKESSMAMSVSRILHLWTCAALDGLECGSCSPSLRASLSGDSPLLRALLEYVYAHWEHPLDGVRHQTKAVFRHLLRMQRAVTGITHANEDPFFTSLTQNLLALEWHSKGKYASLSCLVEYLGAESLLAADAHIPAQLLSLMGDQSLAPYASDLLETLFESHRTQLSSSLGQGGSWLEHWHHVWVSPLLDALCEGQLDQTTYITDYCLPKLLKCSPESLSHMVRVLQSSEQDRSRKYQRGKTLLESSVSNRGALGALMTCLRAARAQGVLRSTQEGVWGGGLIPIALLKQALVHKHDQVRVDALGLICESHRSTEMLSAQEMELLHHFLPNNLNTQSPGVRQQTFSLLRKEFMWWVCETLFQALFPGASFPTRFSALNLLGLVVDTFTFSTQGPRHSLFQLEETLTPARVQAVLECITSGFEEIKSLAFDLLMKLPPSALGFQDTARLKGLLQAALTLSTSTKPYDCVSASYLLNLLVHQGALLRALQLCTEEQRVDLSARERGQEGEAVEILERNTFAVVKYLLVCLTVEIEQAERSLGMVSQWRELVAELISVSYRISAVVSPVVQSSSPEGLIPMDTEPESAASLQQILQEIQPRDTDDFFSEERLLEQEREGGPADDNPSVGQRGRQGQPCQVTAQMVLVCCWRSMKEVSLLLGMVCESLPLQCTAETRDGLLTVQQNGKAKLCK